MPICWVMWSQVPGVPRAWSFAFTLMLNGPYHSANSSGQLRVLLTMMRVKFSLSWATTEYSLYRPNSKPSETKYRMAQASLSRLPEAKP
uniref:Uncharacterized protein n=1 Tax=Echeneis naucrates TaxID=173247 RepID=A0A665UG15_ECHNA